MPSDIVLAADVPILRMQSQNMKPEAQRVRTRFETATLGQAFTAEWAEIDVDHADVAAALMPHARCADLIVASQADPDWPFSYLYDVPERLVIESGRPVLLVPYTGEYDTVGERVLIAWNDRREASRAVFAALPLMSGARQVRVLWINPGRDGVPAVDVPTAEIAHALARHGIQATAAVSVAPGMDVGSELLSRAADVGADLLVMGGYGHTRLREFVLGGATRTILESMTLPVLMSH